MAALGSWARQQMNPEERAAAKAEAKIAEKAAKKASAGRIKELGKTAEKASAAAKASPSIATHEAAAKAHSEAAQAASKHYFGFRGSRAAQETMHDTLRAHEREASTHRDEASKITKADNDRKYAAYVEQSKTPEFKAAALVRMADQHEDLALNTRGTGHGYDMKRAKELEGHYAAHAINNLRDAHAIQPNAGHDVRAAKMEDKHASALSDVPRDDHGRFAPK